ARNARPSRLHGSSRRPRRRRRAPPRPAARNRQRGWTARCGPAAARPQPNIAATRRARKPPNLSPVIAGLRADPSQKRDEKAVGTALLLVQARQKPVLLLDRIIVAALEEGGDDLLAFAAFQRADRVDQPAAWLQPARDAGEHRALCFGQLGDGARADAVEDVRMTAE